MAMASLSSRSETPSSNFAPSLSHPLTCSYRLWLSTSSSPRSPPSPSSTVSFSINKQPSSLGKRSMMVAKKHVNNNNNNNNNNIAMTTSSSSSTSLKKKVSCLCSPTTHPGSFRCAYHKRLAKQEQTTSFSSSCQSNGSSKLNLRRSAMKNSLVRIGGVEGDELARKTLTSLIRPSSNQLLRRRESFQPRPTRLSIVSE
ncbi:hypothetical protein RIF29_30655 [Crotalaria pallida]|uniref:Uncharacterized protein n=1 Tax=Crotalaria pallida TaxID=3830 RepID=A0AAN9EII2_CROPI